MSQFSSASQTGAVAHLLQSAKGHIRRVLFIFGPDFIERVHLTCRRQLLIFIYAQVQGIHLEAAWFEFLCFYVAH